MKAEVQRFKNLKVCLKELEKFIRDDLHLETGRPSKKFCGLRSREILGNWLLCAVLDFEQKSESWMVCTDPYGCDGIISDTKNNCNMLMEHILVSRHKNTNKNTEDLILEHINKKIEKGRKAYASGKSLVVYFKKDAKEWFPNKVAKRLPPTLYFNHIWVFGSHRSVNQEYIYDVVKLESSFSYIWKVFISNDFSEWKIERIQ